MLHCVWRPALHSLIAPLAAHILSSNAGERDTRTNAICGNFSWGSLSKGMFSAEFGHFDLIESFVSHK